MAPPTTTLPSPVIADLAARYTFRKPAMVIDVLSAHPYLIPLLREAGEQIGRHFGPDTPVALQVVVDREAEGNRELFALIETDLPVSEAARRLDDLDAAWWLDALDGARCNLTIDIEPRPTSGVFDRATFLDLADALLAWPASTEAAARTAISRAYYAVFRAARRHLDPTGSVIPPEGRAHKTVWDAFQTAARGLGRKIAQEGQATTRAGRLRRRVPEPLGRRPAVRDHGPPTAAEHRILAVMAAGRG